MAIQKKQKDLTRVTTKIKTNLAFSNDQANGVNLMPVFLYKTQINPDVSICYHSSLRKFQGIGKLHCSTVYKKKLIGLQ